MSGDAGTWLGVIALVIPVAAVAAAVPRVLWRQHGRGHRAGAEHDRAAMLSRVRDKWIDGVLEPSLAHTERLSLDLVRNGREVTQLPVLQMFLRTGGGLLILGAAGGGKTTLLLELADGLLERAESDAGQPVPVVASLATWTGQRQQLDQWLAGELAESYRIPAAAAADWASQGDLVLLLDGLDEVAGRHRDSCAAAINRFLRDRPFARLAVCCRTETARALATELALPQTVELQPAGRAQVDSYLARLETTWTPLADIRTALAADPRLRVPLLLKAAALAKRGGTPPARDADRGGRRLHAPQWPQEIAEIFAPEPLAGTRQAPLDPAAIWDAYLARMLGQHSLAPGADYPEASARGSLAWLAVRLRDTGKTEFLLDHLALETGETRESRESRESRNGRTGQQQVRRLVQQATAWAGRHLLTGAAGLARRLESRGLAGTRAADWLRDTAGRTRPGAWLRQLPQALTQPAKEVAWSADHRPPLTPPLLVVFALPVVTVIAAAAGGWPLALIAALAGGLLWGLNLPERLGLRPRPARPRTVPNESIRRSARHAALAGLAAAAAAGIGLALVSRLAGDLSAPVIVLAVVLAGAGAAVSAGGGACGRHYAARLRLARAGVIPWRYRTFLDAMTDRGLLYRAGSGYLFIHRMLADHLADNYTNPAEKLENPPVGLANTEVIPVALSHEPAYRADQPSSQRVSHRAQQPAGRHSAGAG
jgi:hypothetical protein